MPSVNLSAEETAMLKTYLERALSDLSVEIAGTDRKDYREEIKAERQLLEAVLEKLSDATTSSP